MGRKKRVKKVCEQCGKEFEVIPSRADKARFCSMKCYGLLHRGKNSPHWKGGPVKLICKQCGKGFRVHSSCLDRKCCSTKCSGLWRSEKVKLACEQCGKEFEVKPSQAARGAKFCTKKCRVLSQRGKNHPRWKEKVKLTCQQCGKEFEIYPSRSDTKFCSMQCRGIWQSENLAGENNSRWKERAELICQQCGKEFEVIPSLSDTKFCSMQCKGIWQSENRRGEKAANWQGGKSLELYPQEFNDTLKRAIRKRDNYTCAISGDPGRFVHHINYIKTDCRPGNLITLSHSCHTRTNFNRDLWQALLEPIARSREAGNPVESGLVEIETDPWEKGPIPISFDGGATYTATYQLNLWPGGV